MHVKAVSLFFLIHYVFCDEILLNCNNIREFVDGHNDRRLKLAKGEVENQPPASDMQYLLWDNELEEKAYRWATHYTTSYEPDETISSGRFQINQNIYKAASTDKDYKVNINEVLDFWFNEHSDYTFGPNTSYDVVFGDYLRMAQAKAKYIGCGMAERDEDGIKAIYVVCNYGPSEENYKSQEPYSTGEPSDKLIYDSGEYENRYGHMCDSDSASYF